MSDVTVKAKVEVIVTLCGQEFRLTFDEAKQLKAQLDQAIDSVSPRAYNYMDQ